MSEPATHVALMLKAPRPGLVKTRLAADLEGGNDEAVAIYRRLVEHQWAQLPPSWLRNIHYAPADAEAEFRAWLPGADSYQAQPAGDLGARLIAAAQRALDQGAHKVFLMGADCPGLVTPYLQEADRFLDSKDFVIGPARDGGYTLLGLKATLPSLFEDMPWSTEKVFDETITRANQAGWHGMSLSTLEDVDDLDSWQRQRHHLSAK
ncbi:MAG: TIGR04282 family arsenosugar biosynthesis glycosyltransferase [Verrucomicrobiota bacterium]